VLFELTSTAGFTGVASAAFSAAVVPSPVMDNPIAAKAATMIRVIDIDTPSLLVDIPSATTGVDAAETCYAQARARAIALLKPSLREALGHLNELS
jgi:hypothetical protein